jgi:hypothetical protein
MNKHNDEDLLNDAIIHSYSIYDSYSETEPDCSCAKDHLMLGRWLSELKDLREILGDVEEAVNSRIDNVTFMERIGKEERQRIYSRGKKR